MVTLGRAGVKEAKHRYQRGRKSPGGLDGHSPVPKDEENKDN